MVAAEALRVLECHLKQFGEFEQLKAPRPDAVVLSVIIDLPVDDLRARAAQAGRVLAIACNDNKLTGFYEPPLPKSHGRAFIMRSGNLFLRALHVFRVEENCMAIVIDLIAAPTMPAVKVQPADFAHQVAAQSLLAERSPPPGVSPPARPARARFGV